MSRIVICPADELPHELAAIVTHHSLLAAPNFLNLWSSIGGKGVYWRHDGADGTITLVPGVEFGVSMLTRFMSLTDGLYSRIISIKNESCVEPNQDTTSELFSAIADRKYAKCWLYDYYQRISVSNNFAATDCETSLVDISAPGWEPPDATLRSEIRKAEKEGITVTNFDPAMHLPAFLRLMKATETRHGRNQKYPDHFFAALAKLAQTERRILWKYCERDGNAAASHIFFIEGMLALHWQVYFDKQFSWLKPNQYILAHTIRELRQMGVTTLNLGSTPPEAEGLSTYKEKWGGEPYTYRCYKAKNGLGRLW